MELADHHATSTLVRQRVESGGERFWRFSDFQDLPFSSVAQALSRLAKTNAVRRLSRGLYYRARQTAFGESLPNPAALQELASAKTPVFPAGLAAANLLGFTTQNPARPEVATTAASLPKNLIGGATVVHTRRPAAWQSLGRMDGALLDFLRHGGKSSDLAPKELVKRTLELLTSDGRMARLVAVAATEPPRVRALLGALAETAGATQSTLSFLRRTLNPLSRFAFGPFSCLPAAQAWQAKTGGST